jgi:DUF971 family protein
VKSTNPKNIEVSLSSGVQVDWGDGHHSKYTLEYLRANCPCAACAAGSQKPATPPSPFQMYKKVLKMNGVEPIGRYALQFRWNDGHSTGIYSFDHLRNICPCAECREST